MDINVSHELGREGATKRLLRLTPFVAFSSLSEAALNTVVADVFDAAAAGMAGAHTSIPVRSGTVGVAPSAEVTGIPSMTIVVPDGDSPAKPGGRRKFADFEEVAAAALEIARGTGRVSNTQLREVVPITSDEAREVFNVLMQRGVLARRGVKRGTHYVLPEQGSDADDSTAAGISAPPGTSPEVEVPPDDERAEDVPPSPASPSKPPPQSSPRRLPEVGVTDQRTSDTALRRLLRRGR